MSHVTVPVPASPGGDLGEAALSPLRTQGRARPPDAPLTRFLIRSLRLPINPLSSILASNPNNC